MHMVSFDQCRFGAESVKPAAPVDGHSDLSGSGLWRDHMQRQLQRQGR